MPNCENCGFEHDGSYCSGRFCSSKCARGFSTKLKRQEVNKKVSQKLRSKGRTCLMCRKKFVRDVQDKSGKFCDDCKLKCRSCEKQLSKEELSSGFKTCDDCKLRRRVTTTQKEAGLCFADVCDFEQLWNNEVRKKRLICEVGRFCFKCKLDKWNGLSISLELHHIDGNTKNNKRENCELLCPNCHAQTDTWKWRNIHRI
jgi:hypothetical protein